jgi:G:T-mismatch repair DNA endonuclease (very short patch repair protein)
MERDRIGAVAATTAGWNAYIVWECSLERDLVALMSRLQGMRVKGERTGE